MGYGVESRAGRSSEVRGGVGRGSLHRGKAREGLGKGDENREGAALADLP